MWGPMWVPILDPIFPLWAALFSLCGLAYFRNFKTSALQQISIRPKLDRRWGGGKGEGHLWPQGKREKPSPKREKGKPLGGKKGKGKRRSMTCEAHFH